MKNIISNYKLKRISKNKFSGFTLLEALITIAIIAILAGIVLVAVNPGRQLAQARNAQREMDLTSIQLAIIQYNLETKNWPEGLSSDLNEICTENQNFATDGCVDLNPLVPQYLPYLPIDPMSESGTGYQILLNEINNSLYLVAVNSTEYNLGLVEVGSLMGQAIGNNFMLIYNPNEGQHAPNTEFREPESVSPLSSQEPTRAGHNFLNWNTESDGSGDEYGPEDDFEMPNSNFMLYAIWEEGDLFACSGTIIDDRDGQEYNIIQIGTQCWMQENLNVGTMLCSNNPGGDTCAIDQGTNSENIVKYCYNNLESNCDIYGGLYQWNQAMAGTIVPASQGICPTGWHIPTDDDWKVLIEGQDTPGCEETTGWRCGLAGERLRDDVTASGTNESGFTAKTAGRRLHSGYYESIDWLTYFWTSNETSDLSAQSRILNSYNPGTNRGWNNKDNGISIRCIRSNTIPITTSTLTFNTDGGSIIGSITQEVNTPITPPNNPTKTGHVFVGWSPSIPENMPGYNITHTALWDPIPCNDPQNPACWSPGISGIAWGVFDLTTGVQDLYDGRSNTQSLINRPESFPAAQYCAGLTYNGFNDWYLPASQQLFQVIGSPAHGTFTTGFYWSSTEDSSSPAMNAHRFASGQSHIYTLASKNWQSRVKCMR